MSSPISILRSYVSLNRDASAWIARRFPKTFANPNPSYKANLLGLISDHLQKYKPLKVLEVIQMALERFMMIWVMTPARAWCSGRLLTPADHF